MRRIVLAAALVLMADAAFCQAQATGPGAGGSVLKDPYALPTAPPAGNYVESLIKQAPMPSAYPNPADRYLHAPEEKPDINRDFQVTKELGPWLIMVQSYTTPEASIMARQLVMELRNTYKLHAYTFNYGAEEKRKEFERVKGVIEQQRDYLIKNGFPLDQRPRVRTIHIEEQVGVLLGGYPTEEAARRALDGIRKLKPPDPKKVQLSVKFSGTGKTNEYDKLDNAKGYYVNPFQSAFLAHNPKIKMERPADWDQPDMNLLRKLNAADPLSLLTCQKPFTLVVKDFPTQTVVQTKGAAGAFLESLASGGKSSHREDAAATAAHDFAVGLRKAGIEAYVLHTRYTSIVCVGGYDSPEAPTLRTMKNLLETRLMPQISQYFPTNPNQPMVPSRVETMKIPR